jgi:GntR family transcriptional regulator, transcriptional repressor for pyruvate dehydrogenase complex
VCKTHSNENAVTLSPDFHADTLPAASADASVALPNARRSLTAQLVDALRAQIDAKEMKPGSRLATEAEMVQRFGVSRTVVREALSRLQAAGLVETRHGIGTFVCEAGASTLLQLDPADVAGSIDALAILELRISLETECAGLAAMRCDATRLATMRAALADFARNVGVAADTVAPDLRFHMEIAHATNNRYFVEIMEHLGTRMIPRTRITATPIPRDQNAEYLMRVNREHEQIADAIERGDADSARTAMRLHLINSRERLRRAQASSE